MMSVTAARSSVSTRRPLPKTTSKFPVFDLLSYLDSGGVARHVAKYQRSEKIYLQGEPAKGVKYIQEGGVKLSIVNAVGKEAVVAILGPGDFFGESCLADKPLCIATATAIVPTSIMFIEKNEMLRVLRTEHKFSDRFISHMLSRNIRIEEDLIDQLFNSSEKRLARTLLLLAHYGAPGRPQNTLSTISQETLAEMIGTTRSRVNFFMNSFRKKGYIKYSGYNGQITINNSLLDVVLHE